MNEGKQTLNTEPQIYQALTGDWDSALTSLAGAFGASTAQVTLLYPNLDSAWITHAFGWDPSMLAAAVKLHSSDPRNPALIAKRVEFDEPYQCRQIVDATTLHASKMYRDVLAPAGIEYTLRIQFKHLGTVGALIAVSRGPRAEPFNDADVAEMRSLVPALKAVVQAERNGLARRAARAVIEHPLGPTWVAALVITKDRAIVDSNDYSRVLMDSRGPIFSCGSLVTGRTEAIDEAISALVAEACKLQRQGFVPVDDRDVPSRKIEFGDSTWLAQVRPLELGRTMRDRATLFTELFMLSLSRQVSD